MRRITVFLLLLASLPAFAQFSLSEGWFAMPSSVQATALPAQLLSKDTAPGEYSGIAHIGGNRYALVHNGARGGGIYLADLVLDGEGRLVSSHVAPAPGTEEAADVRDPEGIAYVPETGTLWVAGERDQQILEYDLDGRPTGRAMAVPEDFLPPALSTGNGFESLSYASGTGLMWTVTEEPLRCDADIFPVGEGRRLLRLLAFDPATLQPAAQRFYAMDAPSQVPMDGDTYVHGVSELLALDDGTLLVLEREVWVPAYRAGDRQGMLQTVAQAVTHHKFYLVEPGPDPEVLLSKVLVCAFDTRFPDAVSLLLGADPGLANFEGMCLGPEIGGHAGVLLVNDSERGRGNQYARLQDYVKLLVF